MASLKALWYLKQTGLFADLEEEELAQLSKMINEKEVKKREPVYLPGRPGQTVYVLKEGRIKLSRMTAEGRFLTLDFLEPGDIFGEIAPAENTRRNTMAEALEDSYVCEMNREAFATLLRAKPELALRVVEWMDQKRRRFEVRLDELLYRDVPTRLARLLLRLAEEHGTVSPDGIHVHLGLTHEELANLIATTRETVSKFMSEFRTRRLIDYDAREIRLLDLPALQKRAHVDS